MDIDETLALWPDSQDVPAAAPRTTGLDSFSIEIGVTADGGRGDEIQGSTGEGENEHLVEDTIAMLNASGLPAVGISVAHPRATESAGPLDEHTLMSFDIPRQNHSSGNPHQSNISGTHFGLHSPSASSPDLQVGSQDATVGPLASGRGLVHEGAGGARTFRRAHTLSEDAQTKVTTQAAQVKCKNKAQQQQRIVGCSWLSLRGTC